MTVVKVVEDVAFGAHWPCQTMGRVLCAKIRAGGSPRASREPLVASPGLTRSRDGSTGVATFTFDNPSFLAAASAELGETTGVPCFRRPCHLLCARTVAAARVRRHVPQGRRGHTLDHGGAPPVTCPPDGARSTHAVALTLSCTRAPQVTANFVNGKPRIVKGVVVMKSEGEWDRFMRFMERYGAANGLGFSKA